MSIENTGSDSDSDVLSIESESEALTKRVQEFIYSLSINGEESGVLPAVRQGILDFIPIALREGFHFTSKPINTNANGVGIRLPADSAKETESTYLTVREIINGINPLSSLDYASGATSSPMLNQIYSLSITEFVDIGEDGLVIGTEEASDSTKVKKSYAILISKLIHNLQKNGLEFEQIDNMFPTDKFVSFAEYIEKNFETADALMRLVVTEKFKQKFINSVRDFIEGASNLGVDDARICPNLKSLMFPLDGDSVNGAYITITPLHSMPFNEEMMETVWHIRKSMGKNASDEEKMSLLENGLSDKEISISKDRFPRIIISSMPVGGEYTQNASAISSFKGTGQVFVNHPPFSDNNTRYYYALAHEGYRVWQKNHLNELLSELYDKLHMEYIHIDGASYKVRGTSGKAMKYIAEKYAQRIAKAVHRHIEDMSYSIAVHSVDLSDVNHESMKTWDKSLRDEEWFEKIANRIAELEFENGKSLRCSTITNKARAFIKERLVKELSK